MKLNKLNSLGFSHFVAPLAVVVVVAAVGTYMLVASHAQKLDSQPTTAQPIVDDTPGATAVPRLVAARQHYTAADYIVGTAYAELGNGNKDKYHGPSGLWCAAFATWTWRKASVGIPSLTYTPDIKKWGKAHNRWHTSNPRRGDLALYGSEHVGIVVDVDGSKIKEIDGNWGGRVAYHRSGAGSGGPVKGDWKSFYDGSQKITGFVSP